MSENEPASAGADAARPARPDTVRYAIYALAVRCVFGVLSALSLYSARGEERQSFADANKGKNWSEATLNHNLDVALRNNVFQSVIMVALIGLLMKLLWDGRGWARWIYLVLAVLITHDLFSVFGFFGYHAVLARLTTGLTGLAAIAAIVLLFLPASNAYFRPAGGSTPGLFGLLGGSRSAPGGRAPLGRGARSGSSAAPADPVQPAAGTARTEPTTGPPPRPSGRPGRPRGKSRQTGEGPPR